MKLSILTLSIPSRVDTFLPRIVKQLNEQIGDKPVELLCLLDNQRISIGHKWNCLIQQAHGAYITCVGDDDVMADDYVDSILEAIDEAAGVDVIVFDTDMFRDGEYACICHWGVEHEYRDDWENKELWRGPGELMAIRADIRKAFPYPDVWRGSDWRQAQQMRHAIETQHRIDKVLYHYYNRSDNDEHIKMQRKVNAERGNRGEALMLENVV